MKKIFTSITYSLAAILLASTLLFSPVRCAAQDEAENLEAWAKMYEEMNQASGGEIEKLMKEMEQSGELDALMKELEQSGELDNIIDAMIKSTPQDFIQNLEQEAQKEKPIQAPVTYPEPEPVVATKPSAPVVPVMQVDKSKLKQVQALLNSIVSKIAAIRLKASARTSVQKELTPWEYNLIDLTYYLTTIQDESLAKYLQLPEFASLYDHLVTLNRHLSVEEPRLQVEEMLDIDFEDPYITLGFATSNISRAQAEKRYTELAFQKNPFAVKDQLKKQGLSPAELEAAFKIAQEEYDAIFDAYKRIEQKETSSQAFLAILQALHTAIYKDMVIDDAKKLLAKYDPEALRLKEAQEIKEKEARDYRSRVASQRPEFIPPIFDWPSFGSDKRTPDRAPAKKESGSSEPRTWEPIDRDAGRIQPITSSEAKEKPKAGGKPDAKGGGDKGGKKDDKKDDKKDGAKGKDGKADQAKPSNPGIDSAAKVDTLLKKNKNDLVGALNTIGAFATDSSIANPTTRSQSDEAVHSTQVKKAITDLEAVTKGIEKDLEELGKLKDKKDDEIKKYYEQLQKSFDALITKDTNLSATLKNVFSIKNTATAPANRTNQAQRDTYFGSSTTLVKKLQDAYAKLVFAVHDATPASIKKMLDKVTDLAKKNKNLAQNMRSSGTATPAAMTAITDITKALKDTNDAIEKNQKKDALKIVEDSYKKNLTDAITEKLDLDTLQMLGDVATLVNNNFTKSNGVDLINITPADQAKVRELKTAYDKIRALITPPDISI